MTIHEGGLLNTRCFLFVFVVKKNVAFTIVIKWLKENGPSIRRMRVVCTISIRYGMSTMCIKYRSIEFT